MIPRRLCPRTGTNTAETILKNKNNVGGAAPLELIFTVTFNEDSREESYNMSHKYGK